MGMRIELNEGNCTTLIERDCDRDLHKIKDLLLVPMLLAMGFESDAVSHLFEEKYPNDTEVIPLTVDTKTLEVIDQMALLSGLDRNDMLKALLGFQLYREGFTE